MERPHATAVSNCSHITYKPLFVWVVHRNVCMQYISNITWPKCYFQHGLEVARKILDGDLGSSQSLFSGNFSFYLESHWQLNNVEVNVVQLQDLQGFLQRGTHQLWGVAGIPQLGRQAQALFGCQEERWTSSSWPPTHTDTFVLLTEPVTHSAKTLWSTSLQDKGEGPYPVLCQRQM